MGVGNIMVKIIMAKLVSVSAEVDVPEMLREWRWPQNDGPSLTACLTNESKYNLQVVIATRSMTVCHGRGKPEWRLTDQ